MVGQEVSDSTRRNIADAIGRLEPPAEVKVTHVPLPENSRKVIVLHVDGAGADRPFCYKGRAYMRVESVTTTMPQSRYDELVIQREQSQHGGWETYTNPYLGIADLDEGEILKTVRLGVENGRLPETTGNDVLSILEKLGVMEDGTLNNVAAVLFAKRKLAQYPQNLLRLARFKGTDKTVFMDNRRVYGNIFQQLDEAMAFLFKHLSLSGTTDVFEREEHLTIPYKAIREGVVNALCHRDFRNKGGSTAIAVYDDRVEIENPGTFPMGWSLEKIKSEHSSKPHNPLIADVLYIRKVLESWGRGISLMMEECSKANLPEPEYIMDADEVRLVFRYSNSARPSDQAIKRLNTDQAPTKHRPSKDDGVGDRKGRAFGEGNYGTFGPKPPTYIQGQLPASRHCRRIFRAYTPGPSQAPQAEVSPDNQGDGLALAENDHLGLCKARNPKRR